MSERKKKKMRGAIAVFLSLIMLGMTVFECVLIDESRIIAAKSVISGSGDLALNSALTNYDQVLYEVYGLFATSSEADIEKNIEDYFNRTIQGAGIDGSLDDINNMLGLMLEDGSLELMDVTGSSLANQDVLANQILEYMKFRGPVNIGFGLLEKIEAFKDFNKQTEAMEAQLDFEEKLDSLQDACQKVYDKANALKKVSEEAESKGDGLHNYLLDTSYISSQLSEFERLLISLSDVKNLNTEMKKENYKFTDMKLDDLKDKDYDDYVDDIDLLHELVGAMRYPDTFVSILVPESEDYAKHYEDIRWYASQIMENEKVLWPDMDQYGLDLRGYADNVKEHSSEMKGIYRLLLMYETWYSKADRGAEEKEFYESNIEFIKEKVQEMKEMGQEGLFSDACEDFELKVMQRYRNAGTELGLRDMCAEEQGQAAGKLQGAIDCGSHTNDKENYCCLKSAVEMTQNAKNEWKDKIENLPDGNTKTSMQGTYESEAEGIDLSKCDVLLNSTISIEDYLKKYLEYLKGYKFYYGNENKVIIDTYIDIADSEWKEFMTGVSDAISRGDSIDYITYPSTYPELPAILSYPHEIHHVISNDEFYQFLSKICGETETEEDSDKKNAKEIRDGLMDKGNDKNNQEIQDLEQGDVDWDQVIAFTDEISSDDPNDASVAKSSKNKKISKNAKKSMKNTTGFLDGLGEVFVKARNDVYLTEYAVGMFSCYTTGKKDGKELPEDKAPHTIAGDDTIHLLNKDNNVLYRSEQEYILWGNHNQQTNVNNTLLSIFGIRFALNTLYAFVSDPEINAVTLAWATAIAGWTGFGVPLVQSVLKVALALAESTYDIMLLKDGYDVAFYKTNATWVMKPSGMSKEFIDKTSDELSELAAKQVDHVFQYADNVATEAIDNVETTLENTIKEAEKTIIDSAVATIVSPFEKLMVTASSQTGLSDEQIRTRVEEVYGSIYDKAAKDDSKLGELEVFLLDQCGTTIKETMTTEIINLKNNAAKGAQNLIDSGAKNLRTKLEELARGSDIVKKLGNEVREKVSNAIQDVNTQVQESVSETVSESVSSFLNGIQGSNAGESSVTSGFAMTINYQEYVHIFLLLKSMTNGEQYLNRIGQLIQINMGNRNGKFALNNCYTMLQLNATVKVKTTFLGKLDTFLENPVGGQTEYKLKYKGLQGY